MDELVQGMEEMQETVESISREKEEALAKLEHLKEQSVGGKQACVCVCVCVCSVPLLGNK